MDSGKGTAAAISALSEVGQAAAHLRSALVIVDGPATDLVTGPAESALYDVGEARRAVHSVLFALSEWFTIPVTP